MEESVGDRWFEVDFCIQLSGVFIGWSLTNIDIQKIG